MISIGVLILLFGVVAKANSRESGVVVVKLCKPHLARREKQPHPHSKEGPLPR